MLERIKDVKKEQLIDKAKSSKYETCSYSKLGKFYIDNKLEQGVHMDVLGEFLCTSVAEIIKESYRVMGKTKKSPYTYNEKDFHKILAPALARTVKGFMMKSPARVKWGNLNGEQVQITDKDWADYRCRYKDYNYCIKANKKSISYTTGQLSEKVKEEWQTSCAGLEEVKRVIEAEQIEDTNGIRNTMGITLEILNVYVSGTEQEALNYDTKGLCELRKSAVEQISKKYDAKWSCLWILDKEAVPNEEYIHGFEKYPAVIFIARAN